MGNPSFQGRLGVQWVSNGHEKTGEGNRASQYRLCSAILGHSAEIQIAAYRRLELSLIHQTSALHLVSPTC